MAEDDKRDPSDELDGVTEDEARKLLENPTGTGQDDSDDDPDGADQLGDAGKRALDSIKEQRRAARDERDKAKAELDQVRAELRKHTDKDKGETQRLTEERDALKARVEKAEGVMRRREVAEEHAPEHATAAQIRAVAKRLAGDTDEQLAADAAELYALIAPAPKNTVPSKPRERLRGGGDPPGDDADNETDPLKIAARVPRAR